MSDENTKNDPKVQADNNSVAIGSLSIGGNVGGNIIIGNTSGYTSEEVSVLIAQITSTFQPKPFDGQCPYKGLDVFEEEDAGLFFGREKLVEDLVSRVKESRTVFVTGSSGSGKSSLVRAGLLHTLKQGGIQESHSERWLYAVMKPERDPFDALANALSRLRSPELGNYLRQNKDQAGILDKCAESVLTDRNDQRLVLFIDQFEEVFTQVSRDAEREQFLNLLTHAASKEGGRVTILFAMRSDFIPDCATYPQLNALLNRQFIQIGGMQPDELVSAIAQPALRVGLRIEPDLIVHIIKEMQGQTGALPLMQFALKDLFDSQKEKNGIVALTLNDYLHRGGIHKALERHADASLVKLDEKERELARSIFSGLIAVGRGTQDTRRTALFKELTPASENANAVQSIVRKLADARLITTDEQTATISHEKLIDAWPWLKKLVNENRDVIALQNEIAEHAREWDDHKQDESYLYTGGRLVNAREKLETKKLVLSELAQQFVSAGIKIDESKQIAEERRRQKELEDARKLAETAQAQAKAERRARLVTIWMLVGTVAFVVGLSINPIKRAWLRQQARVSEMVTIPTGDYVLGDERLTEEEPYKYLAHDTYHISSFSIDSYPVTNKRYRFCIEADVCSRPDALQAEYADTDNDNKIVVNITAIDAAEFCNWLGMRLPSEKEWELSVHEKAFELISPDNLTDAVYFFEWTTSSYNIPVSEWTDASIDPPEWLINKGGDLSQTFEDYMTQRQDQRSTKPDFQTGFRCATDK